ncbi:MAG: glycoside hydrolase [Bacteroidales bacterium]|nr:glycoside hydrolase [Bacteroidales bacterium]
MSIQKRFLTDKGVCQITFVLPESITNTSKKVAVVGDFNNWSSEKHPMKKNKDGKFKCTVELPLGKEYQYRYLLDDTRWENDWDNDGLVATPYKDTYNSSIML